MSRVMDQWQQIAIALGDDLYRQVNSPSMVGGDDETGYCLFFFNVKNHGGKSTMVSSHTNKAELKRILKEAIRNLDGPKSKIVPPAKYAH